MISDSNNQTQPQSMLENNESNQTIDRNVVDVCVDDMIRIDGCEMAKISDHELIRLQFFLIIFLKKLVKTDTDTNIKIDDLVQYFAWLSKTSEHLALKSGQKIHSPNKTTKGSIPRSSYNFCPHSFNCRDYYVHGKCSFHHFVHSMIKHDSDAIINHFDILSSHSDNLTANNTKNLFVSINTLAYVIKHMYYEINSINVSNKIK